MTGGLERWRQPPIGPTFFHDLVWSSIDLPYTGDIMSIICLPLLASHNALEVLLLVVVSTLVQTIVVMDWPRVRCLVLAANLVVALSVLTLFVSPPEPAAPRGVVAAGRTLGVQEEQLQRDRELSLPETVPNSHLGVGAHVGTVEQSPEAVTARLQWAQVHGNPSVRPDPYRRSRCRGSKVKQHSDAKGATASTPRHRRASWPSTAR